jgi:hypothetical protein
MADPRYPMPDNLPGWMRDVVRRLEALERPARTLDVAVDHDTWLDETITTTLTTFATVTLTRPDWASRALVTASLGLQVSNNTGSQFNALGAVDISGLGGASLEMTIPSGTTDAVSVPMSWNLTDLTGDITIRGQAQVNTGSSTGNYGSLAAQAVWLL